MRLQAKRRAFRRKTPAFCFENLATYPEKQGCGGSFFFPEMSDFKVLKQLFLPTPAMGSGKPASPRRMAWRPARMGKIRAGEAEKPVAQASGRGG
jgi:hypothetical protein